MRISTFFDPNNYEHVVALMVYYQEDEFPEEFEKLLKENNVFFTKNWKRALEGKMADCWMDYILDRRHHKARAEWELVKDVD